MLTIDDLVLYDAIELGGYNSEYSSLAYILNSRRDSYNKKIL